MPLQHFLKLKVHNTGGVIELIELAQVEYSNMESLRKAAIKYAVRGLYHFVSSLDPESDLRVLNYGFDNGMEIPLDPQDQSHRYRLSLYHHVASAIDLSDKDVLEIGSGRGGGASYIARYFNPRSIDGIDISDQAIQFCQGYYSDPKLSFKKGDAEALDCKDDSYDVVVNIESSHNYPDMSRFLAETHRVLRLGGFFLFADIRAVDEVGDLRSLLENSRFRIVREEDITLNVLAALDKDNDQKIAFMKRRVPKFLWLPFSTFAGFKGTRFYNQLQSGDLSYINLILQKE